MRLHPRATIVRVARAEFAIELLNSKALEPLTYVERMMVMSAVLGHELSEYILQDLRVERHGCDHIKADEYREPGEECWRCKEEEEEEEGCAE